MRECLLPILQPLNNINPHSIVILASIHHVEYVVDLIEQAGAKICFLLPYSPDLMPLEGVVSQVKNIMKENDCVFQVSSMPRLLISMCFSMVSTEDCMDTFIN